MLCLGIKYNTEPDAEAVVFILPDGREIRLELLPRDRHSHNRIMIDAPKDVRITRRPCGAGMTREE